MRRQTLFLWSAYFASIEKIALTAIETVRDRIYRQTSHHYLHWNNWPGAYDARVAMVDIDHNHRLHTRFSIFIFEQVVCTFCPIFRTTLVHFRFTVTIIFIILIAFHLLNADHLILL